MYVARRGEGGAGSAGHASILSAASEILRKEGEGPCWAPASRACCCLEPCCCCSASGAISGLPAQALHLHGPRPVRHPPPSPSMCAGPGGYYRGMRTKIVQSVLAAALLFVCKEKIADATRDVLLVRRGAAVLPRPPAAPPFRLGCARSCVCGWQRVWVPSLAPSGARSAQD